MILSVLFSVLALARAIPVDNLDKEWESYKLTYAKEYTMADDLSRRSIWEQSRNIVQSHNREHEEGKHSFAMGMNEFSDMTDEEFNSRLMKKGLIKDAMKDIKRVEYEPEKMKPIPRHLDWRDYGAVTPVKYQGHCGSCFAFSAVAAIESAYFLHTCRLAGFCKLLDLSEQQVLDCSENNGCRGGLMTNVFEYLTANYEQGLAQEKDYPYISIYGEDNSCYQLTKSGNETVRITSYEVFPKGDETYLTSRLIYGPIAVGVTVPPYMTRFYKSGILHCVSNRDEDIRHAVLLVGYGEENGQEYYILKNSWGNSWGENGYFRILRNKDNACAIASMASVPLIENQIEKSSAL